MTVTVTMPPMEWVRRPWDARVTDVCRSWAGTPYRKGQRCKGRGVDCVRFVAAVLDELYGYERERFERLPQDMSLHNRAGAVAAMRRFLRIYEPNVAVADGVVEAGDVVIVGPPRGGPGHALIVGGDDGVLWHVDGDGVRSTGRRLFGFDLYCIYRVLGKDQWVRDAA